MDQPTTDHFSLPDASPKDILTELLHQGAQRMLATAIEAEVADLDSLGHPLPSSNIPKARTAAAWEADVVSA